MQMTKRDADMLEWLSVVRVADVDAVRWALAGLAGSNVPVTPRQANMWITPLVEVALLGRARPDFRDGSVIAVSSSTMSIASRSDRASRASFATTRVSPPRLAASDQNASSSAF